ncbi:AAA family ATPase [Hwanghaeella sp.]|uniref:AAA family ATPase n=1 Tax=Hwanghaeella sp. TaxID=2605943 RepID=UPI003CCC208A
MIIRAEIENYGSICGRQIFDLSVPSRTPEDVNRYSVINSDTRAPRVAAVFGPNASGKSSVLSALVFARDFAADAASVMNDGAVVLAPFTECKDGSSGPLSISVEFSARWLDNTRDVFRYSVRFRRTGPFTGEVMVEELAVRKKGSWTKLFWREEDRIGASELSRFSASEISFMEKTVSLNSGRSFLKQVSILSKDNLAKVVTSDILNSLQTNIPFHRTKGSQEDSALTKTYSDNKDLLSQLRQMIRTADIGIADVEVETFGPAPGDPDGEQSRELYFNHTGLRRPLPLFFESDGTKNFVNVFPRLAHALANGGVAIMDELDTDLHPNLLKEIVSWFHDPNQNKKDAQLILSCNSASLLHYLEKDEIFFTEKSSFGTTRIYGLKDIEDVRRTENFYKKYLSGEYGAIPNFG